MISFFDRVEENKLDAVIFCWTKTLPSYNSCDILYEGILITIDSSGVFKPNKYLLTYKGLFKYKV